MIKTNSKKLAFYILSIILTIAVVIICFISSQSTASAAEKQTDILVAEIQYRIEESLKTEEVFLENGMPLGMSSNPYDYIKNNAEYDKLIELGDDVLDDLYMLQQNQNKYDSFQRYIIAIAIEEITKTDLKQSDEYFWQDANSFSQNWNKFSNDAEQRVMDILTDDSLSDDKKTENICFYGTLAKHVLENLDNSYFSEEKNNTIQSIENKIENSTRNELVEFSTHDQD